MSTGGQAILPVCVLRSGPGLSVISIAAALRDPAYRRNDAYVGGRGLSWIHRWALDDGKPAPAQPEPSSWVMKLQRAR